MNANNLPLNSPSRPSGKFHEEGAALVTCDLRERFSLDGFVHTLIHAAHPVYIYAKERREASGVCPETFEVIKARWRGGCVLNGKAIPARWHYPGNERWGVDGFTCTTRARAAEKMSELLREYDEREAA